MQKLPAKQKIDPADKKLVEGLISRDINAERAFVKDYRQQILDLFTISHKRLGLSTELTDKMKEEMFNALCDNLHSSDDKQLKKFLSEERFCSFAAFLSVKAIHFCQDKLLVRGLKERDRIITTRLFFGKPNDDLSLQPIMKKILHAKDIHDPEQRNKRMSSKDFASEIYLETMNQIEKFRFECSLKTFFITSVIRTYLKNYFKKLREARLEVNLLDYKSLEMLDSIDYVSIERNSIHEYFEGLFKVMANQGVNPNHIEVLKYRYIDGLSAQEVSTRMGISENLVNQWTFKTIRKLINAARNYNK